MDERPFLEDVEEIVERMSCGCMVVRVKNIDELQCSPCLSCALTQAGHALIAAAARLRYDQETLMNRVRGSNHDQKPS